MEQQQQQQQKKHLLFIITTTSGNCPGLLKKIQWCPASTLLKGCSSSARVSHSGAPQEFMRPVHSGCVLTSAAQGSGQTCGPLLPVIPPPLIRPPVHETLTWTQVTSPSQGIMWTWYKTFCSHVDVAHTNPSVSVICRNVDCYRFIRKHGRFDHRELALVGLVLSLHLYGKPTGYQYHNSYNPSFMASEIRTHCFTAHSCSGLCLKRETKNGVCNLQITSRSLFSTFGNIIETYSSTHFCHRAPQISMWHIGKGADRPWFCFLFTCHIWGSWIQSSVGEIYKLGNPRSHIFSYFMYDFMVFISFPAPSFISVFLLAGPLVQFSPLPPRSRPSLSRRIALWNYKDGNRNLPHCRIIHRWEEY